MPAPRIGLYNTNTISFPKGLMNTSISSNINPYSYAQLIENYIPCENVAAAGTKRFGCKTILSIAPEQEITNLIEYCNEQGISEILIVTNKGNIYLSKQDQSQTLSPAILIWSNLSQSETIDYQFFNQKIILTNGVDSPLCYDGKKIFELFDWITDQNASFAVIDESTLELSGEQLNLDNYSKDKAIKLAFESYAETEYKIIDSSLVANKLTLKLSAPIKLQPVSIAYKKNPPPFSSIFAFNDRLFATSAGTTKIDKLRGNNGLYIYYTKHANNPNSWYDNNTGELNYINTSGKHEIFDEFIKISSFANNLVFFGRKKLQIWQGYNPSDPSDFTFVKTITVGLFHPKLILPFENDLLFVTDNGLRSLTNIIETGEIKAIADIGTAIYPTIKKAQKNIILNKDLYNKSFAFSYSNDGFYGFKTGELCLIYFISEQIKGFLIFSGIFKNANSIINCLNCNLLLANKNNILIYSNGNDGKDPLYHDNGEPIKTIWQSKWIRLNQRLACNYFNLIFDRTEKEQITFKRISDAPNPKSKISYLQLGNSNPFWDEAKWDQSNWKLGSKEPVIQDKFISNSYSFVIETNDKAVGSTILGVKLLGK